METNDTEIYARGWAAATEAYHAKLETFCDLESRYNKLVFAVRETLNSYDEWRKPEQGCVSRCDFWENLDKLEELEKRENAKVYCMKCGENVAYLGD